MDSLRFSGKFLILGIIYLIAVMAVGLGLYLHLSRVVNASRQELAGIEQVIYITKTKQLLQSHRGISASLLGGDESMRSVFASNEAALQGSLAKTSQSIASGSVVHKELQDLYADWERIRQEGQAWTASDNFVAHSRLLGKFQGLKRHLADESTLTVDPDIDVHYLLDTSIQTLPMALENIAKIRGLGAGVLAKKHLSSDQKLAMGVLLSDLSVAKSALAVVLAETVRYNPSVGQYLTANFRDFDNALSNLLALVENDILAERFERPSADFFNQATSVIDHGYRQLFESLLPTAQQLILVRIEKANAEILVSAGIALALFLVACSIFAGIYYSTIGSVQALANAAGKFAAGDFSKRVQLLTRDEIAQVGVSFNRMADGFNAMLDIHKDNEERLRSVVNSALDAVIQMDRSGRITGWSAHGQTIFGWATEEVLGRTVHETIIPTRYRERHLLGMARYLSSGKGVIFNTRVEIEGLHRDGHEIPIELSISSSYTTRGVEFCAFVRDITDRKKAQADLRIAAIAFNAGDGIVIADAQGNTLSVNQAFTDITGFANEEMVGKSPFILNSQDNDDALLREMWRALATDKFWQGEFFGRHKSGEDCPQWIKVTAVTDGEKVANYVVSISDISQRKIAEKTIHKLAFYDPLTELPNRRLLLDRVQQFMGTSRRSLCYGALLLIDLDHFKLLNDSLGHHMGDRVLLQVSMRLANCVREGDTVARVGGDEFVVMLGGLDSEAEMAAAQAEEVGRNILAALSQVYGLDDTEYRSSASLGATLFRSSETTFEDLFKQVELALYRSKDSGRNTLNFFDSAMQRVVLERMALESELRKAIQHNDLVLHYQPQITSDGSVSGAEALVRWHHPLHGIIPPGKFIPLAEESGLILSLGDWVLETACKQLVHWATRPELSKLILAVNVSARQFYEVDFSSKVLAIIARTGARADHLKLELTESLLVDNVDDIIEKMSVLKAHGISFSLDDFGTGYSSLAYLKRLPLDQLKIDQSFVCNILIDPNEAAIAKTIVALGYSLGLDVIAEGVETQAQRDFLAEVNCNAFQGYFFSRPLPIDQFEKYVRQIVAMGEEPVDLCAGTLL
jgi:diguanylate cyclase (GGDEF)-like protein/PAS domain S-box-containing protein